MVDFRVSDGFPSHPKTLGLSLEAIGLWMLAGTWCARYLTDGYIPRDAMAMYMNGSSRPVDELVERNLLAPVADGWLFVDWSQWQRTKADVESERAQWRARQARARRKRWGNTE